ncbi:MAG: flavodoxin/ferredoxin-dependent (E)-4-hydroxy-3-methylbut-2-enyl-diphosphate synthase [Planctomycetia bacterium]|nr:flavodoxin/ferredoxin-dependent (E)-4-hydroxy-3-methylbut-2-enyl-diphosphate synthase [Planctomycetia bacterium]
MTPRTTRKITIGPLEMGGNAPIVVQSMAAVKTTLVPDVVATVNRLSEAGAALVRLAVDTHQDVLALAEIRAKTAVPLSVDLQENFRLAEEVAPYVDKIRYNPGHLYHNEPNLPWQKKVAWLVQVAVDFNCALRIGVNCGSLDPEHAGDDDPMLQSALEHADFLESLGFTRFCVSLKSSDPAKVLDLNRTFARQRPAIPLHLGVTEAGAPPWGIIKSRMALEPLLAEGIGDTLRVSLTVENDRKAEEVLAGLQLIQRVEQGDVLDPASVRLPKLNIVSCPSCARVENSRFVQLAEQVRAATEFASDYPLKIAVMGCRVNGPGETDDADFGLWCGPNAVHLKEGSQSRGTWPYDEVIAQLLELLRVRGIKQS